MHPCLTLKIKSNDIPFPKKSKEKILNKQSSFNKSIDDKGVIDEVPTNEDVGNEEVVDNRHSSLKPLKIKNGLKCSFCQREFKTKSFYDMHLCTNGDGGPIFQ